MRALGARDDQRGLDRDSGDRRHVGRQRARLGLHQWQGHPQAGPDAEHMRIATLVDDIVHRGGATAAHPVRDLQAHGCKVFGLQRGRDGAGEYVGTAAGAVMRDDLDRPCGHPSALCAGGQRCTEAERGAGGEKVTTLHVFSALF